MKVSQKLWVQEVSCGNYNDLRSPLLKGHICMAGTLIFTSYSQAQWFQTFRSITPAH